MTPWRPPASSGRRVAAVLVLVGVAVAGCTPSACPAIGWGRTLTVELADGWPAGTGRTVHLECTEPCDVLSLQPRGPGEGPSSPVLGTTATFQPTQGAFESVVVTVLDAEGAELARVEAEPEWVRVGGTEECGGPTESTVTVPAP